MSVKHPYIKWADRKASVFFKIDVQDGQNTVVQITKKSVKYSGSNKKGYVRVFVNVKRNFFLVSLSLSLSRLVGLMYAYTFIFKHPSLSTYLFPGFVTLESIFLFIEDVALI